MQVGLLIAVSLSTALPALGFDELNQTINQWIQSLSQVSETTPWETSESYKTVADDQETYGEDTTDRSDSDLDGVDGSLDDATDEATLDAVSADGQPLEAIEESRPDELDELAEVDGYGGVATEGLTDDDNGALGDDADEIDWTQPID
jgi:hypothetical protein